MPVVRKLWIILLLALTSACATAPALKDYSGFYDAQPRSVLIVPVINHTNEVEAANLFLTTATVPLAERGYYVFPVNMVRDLMEADGLSDPGFVHAFDSVRLGALFNTDSILYVEILDWDSNYFVIGANLTVEFLYTLKDAKTGALLWQEQQRFVQDRSGSSGNIFADMIATAIVAAVDSGRSDYTPLAIAANDAALLTDGRGLPRGPHHPEFGTDQAAFPATGNGNMTNAKASAVAYPVENLPTTVELGEKARAENEAQEAERKKKEEEKKKKKKS